MAENVSTLIAAVLPRWRDALLVKPDTMLRWHRESLIAIQVFGGLHHVALLPKRADERGSQDRCGRR